MIIEDDEFFDRTLLERHKEIIEERLELYAPKPAIWSKYLWSAHYHNFYCDQNQKAIDVEMKINIDRFAPGLSRIIS